MAFVQNGTNSGTSSKTQLTAVPVTVQIQHQDATSTNALEVIHMEVALFVHQIQVVKISVLVTNAIVMTATL